MSRKKIDLLDRNVLTSYFDDYEEFCVEFDPKHVKVDLSGMKDGLISFRPRRRD